MLGYVQTIKGSVNIRAAIGGTSLTQVAKYVTMPYLLSPVKRGNYTWYFVQLSNGMKGYVRGDCVKIVKGGGGGGGGGTVTPTPTPTSTGGGGGSTDTPTGYVTTTMDNVNIRKGVWGDLVTVCKKKGTTFPYYGEPRVSGSVKWYFIKGDFGFAYIHGGYLPLGTRKLGTFGYSVMKPKTQKKKAAESRKMSLMKKKSKHSAPKKKESVFTGKSRLVSKD